MAFAWSRRLSVGVPSIDRQHQELISHVNRLLDAMRQRKGDQETGRLLKFLEDYVVVHFSAEEDLMMEHDYGGYAAHQAEHAEFVRDICRLKDEMISSQGATMPMMRSSAGCATG